MIGRAISEDKNGDTVCASLRVLVNDVGALERKILFSGLSNSIIGLVTNNFISD